jgi:hypothetical protein
MTTPAHSSETQCFSSALRSRWFCSGFVNSMLEDLHVGISPSSAAGDYSDVTVSSPYGVIPWRKVSRLNDDEMKRLIIDVVDRAYRFIHMLLDGSTGGELLSLLAERDPLPQWNEPTVPPNNPISFNDRRSIGVFWRDR